jgi:hypothetical protein
MTDRRLEFSARKEDSPFHNRYRNAMATQMKRSARAVAKKGAAKKAGTRKGGAKKKGGRPFIGRVARVHISLTVTPQTQAALKREARRRGISIGLLVDDLAEPFRARR